MSLILLATAALLGLSAARLEVAPQIAGLEAAPPAAQETPAVRVLRTGGLKVESAALLVSGEQGGSLHVAVLPLFFPGSGGVAGKVRVPVVLEIDGATLLHGNRGELVRIEVCLYALSAAGAVQGALLETIEADLTRAGPAIERSGVQYTGELALAPGDYSLRVLVRNALTGEVGLRILPLTVPDFASGPLLLPPAFPNPDPGAWTAALSKTARDSPPALESMALPAAQPVLGLGQEARFELPVWKLKAPAALRVEILRSGGGHVAELPAKIEARRETTGLERLTVSFVPAGLEPGRYLVRAAIPEGPGAGAPAWSSLVVLLAEGGGGKVWAELLHGGPSREATAAGHSGHSEPAEPAEPARPRGRRLDAGPVREAYRHALQLLAAGDEAAARRAVAALEASLLTGQNPADSEDVGAVELGIAQDLAAAAPQSLIPLAVLHESLYRDALQHHELVLTAHAREVVIALAGLAAKHGGEAGRHTAARLLLGLAAQLVRSAPSGFCGLCERTFRQVLAFEEDNEPALLYRAVDAERNGRYPEAVVHLERLHKSHPESAEARVRLAVNLRRLGKPRDADRLLAGLLQEPAAAVVSEGTESTAWVLALAYHETGRALLAAGRLDEAEKTLRDGLRRLPGDEKLLVELAGVFDLERDPAQARQILAGFKPVHDGAESARRRYGRLPTEILDRAWADLVKNLPGSLPALAAALKPAARKGS